VPTTRSSRSTTRSGSWSGPMRQVPAGWCTVMAVGGLWGRRVADRCHRWEQSGWPRSLRTGPGVAHGRKRTTDTEICQSRPFKPLAHHQRVACPPFVYLGWRNFVARPRPCA
jgi:hypothetical protein